MGRVHSSTNQCSIWEGYDDEVADDGGVLGVLDAKDVAAAAMDGEWSEGCAFKEEANPLKHTPVMVARGNGGGNADASRAGVVTRRR